MGFNSRIKSCIFIFLLLISIACVSAVPPFIQQASLTSVNGLQIQYNDFKILSQNQNYDFNFHVMNMSNGMPIIKGIVCNIDIYNVSGTHILSARSTTPDSRFDYNFSINGANFSSIGEYNYILFCNSSDLGGFISNNIVVTQTGQLLSPEDSGLFSYFVLFMLGLSLLLIYLSRLIEANDWIQTSIKVLIISFALYMLYYPLSLAAFVAKSTIHSNSINIISKYLGAYQKFMWVLAIFALCWFLYLLFTYMASNAKDKEKSEWQP
jgi:hypothetical protein